MAKALKNYGPLIASTDHRWAMLVPGTWDADTYAPHISVPYGDIISGVVPGAIFDTALADRGIHFAVKPSRLAKFFQDAGEAEPDDWPVFEGQGQTPAKATPIRLPPDGPSIYDDGRYPPMDTPWQSGWD